MNQGRLMHQQGERDPYVKAVRQLVGGVLDERAAPRERAPRRWPGSGWLHGLRRRGEFLGGGLGEWQP